MKKFDEENSDRKISVDKVHYSNRPSLNLNRNSNYIESSINKNNSPLIFQKKFLEIERVRKKEKMNRYRFILEEELELKKQNSRDSVILISLLKSKMKI